MRRTETDAGSDSFNVQGRWKERLQETHNLATLRRKRELEELLETAVKEHSDDTGRQTCVKQRKLKQ